MDLGCPDDVEFLYLEDTDVGRTKFQYLEGGISQILNLLGIAFEGSFDGSFGSKLPAIGAELDFDFSFPDLKQFLIDPSSIGGIDLSDIKVKLPSLDPPNFLQVLLSSPETIIESLRDILSVLEDSSLGRNGLLARFEIPYVLYFYPSIFLCGVMWCVDLTVTAMLNSFFFSFLSFLYFGSVIFPSTYSFYDLDHCTIVILPSFLTAVFAALLVVAVAAAAAAAANPSSSSFSVIGGTVSRLLKVGRPDNFLGVLKSNLLPRLEEFLNSKLEIGDGFAQIFADVMDTLLKNIDLLPDTESVTVTCYEFDEEEGNIPLLSCDDGDGDPTSVEWNIPISFGETIEIPVDLKLDRGFPLGFEIGGANDAAGDPTLKYSLNFTFGFGFDAKGTPAAHCFLISYS